MNRNKRKDKERVPQNENTSGNQAPLQKYYQRNIHVGSSPNSIRGIILKMDKGGTQII